MGEERHPSEALRTAALERALGWAERRTFDAGEYSVGKLLELRGERSIAVVIPSKQAATTVGSVVGACAGLRTEGVVDELIVVDANSTDGSAEIAEAAGARVLQEADLMPQFGVVAGKGDALWRTLSVVESELVVFVDADTDQFSERFVCGLVGPLLADDRLQLVKGAFERPFISGELRIDGGGGRVNELVARPLLNTYFPELAAVRQPLAGEFAARSAALVELPFRTGYGVEIALLIDVYERFGLEAIGQAELGERLNNHQALEDLAPMAFEVQRALISRVDGVEPGEQDGAFVGYFDGRPQLREVPSAERPPLATLIALESERA